MAALFRVLTTPTDDFHGITSVLVEGGRKTWEAFRKAKIVDCEVILIGKGAAKYGINAVFMIK
jgi:riboflavin biosynthesis pyrimidine reductase